MTRRQQGALAGRRVIELADASGVYCGKLLADLGADVVKVEPPGGDLTRRHPPFAGDAAGPDASLFFLYMNTNKRGVVLDFDDSAGRERFANLVADADLVIDTWPAGGLDALGIGYEALSAPNPALVWTSISGFGSTGPDRACKSSELIAAARGGAMYVTGGHPDDPPVKLAGSQLSVMASTVAAASSLIALYHSHRTGRGQFVDISTLESTIAVTHVCGVGKWLDDGLVPRRAGTGLFASVPSGAYRCRDGLVYLMVNRPLHWQALAEWIHEETGNQEVLDPMFEGPSSNRIPYREMLDLFITDLTSKHSVDTIYREGQRRHIAFTPVNTAIDVIRDAHLAARSFFVDVPHSVVGSLRYPGAPYRHERTPWAIERPAPRLGEHDDEVFRELAAARPKSGAAEGRRDDGKPQQALAGLRVVEFTAGMAGPWIGRFLAWCGAEIIKVESRKRPSVVRLYVPPREPERGTQEELSPWFTDWDAGKQFVALDLARPEGAELARRLVARADVVIENARAGAMEKLGLGIEQLRAVNPDVVMFSTSGYGDSGPDSAFVTWGPNIEALSGLSALSGFPERECTITQYAYPDALSALHGLVAVMAALDHRDRTGEGQAINLSQLEATIASVGDVMMEALATGRESHKLANGSLFAAPHGCYPCRGEDRWCVIAVETDEEWAAFVRGIGEPSWARDERFAKRERRVENSHELDRLIAEWTANHSAEEVANTLQEAGIAAAVVQTVEDEYERDPQLAARHAFETIEHRVKGPVVATGIPLGLTGTPGHTPAAGGAIGQDNVHVFRELLGLSEAEYEAYREAGAIED